MYIRIAKVLLSPSLMLIIGVILGFCSMRYAVADSLPTNHVKNSVTIQAAYYQTLHSIQPFLTPANARPSIAQLQSMLDAGQKYFSSKRQYERSLFNQLQERQFNSGGVFVQAQSIPPFTPSIQSILIEVLQDVVTIKNIKTLSPAELIHLRDLLHQLRMLDQGHLSGAVWLYDSPLSDFAKKHLVPINHSIIQKSLRSAAALRKKHKYAAAQKIYKNLLADYADTPEGSEIKVHLQAAIVEDYNYQAKTSVCQA